MSSPSSFGFGSLFSILADDSPPTVSSSYYFHGDEPSRAGLRISPTLIAIEVAEEAEHLPELNSSTAVPSPTYYFGQLKSGAKADGHLPPATLPAISPAKVDVHRLKATYFGLIKPEKGHDGVENGDGCAVLTGSNVSISSVAPASSVVTLDLRMPSTMRLNGDAEIGHVNGLVTADGHSLKPDDAVVVHPSETGTSNDVSLNTIHFPGLLGLDCPPSEVPPFSVSTTAGHVENALLSSLVLPVGDSPSGPKKQQTKNNFSPSSTAAGKGMVEYLVLLQKPPEPVAPTAHSDGLLKQEESPPSVRQLRHRFESPLTPATAAVADHTDKESVVPDVDVAPAVAPTATDDVSTPENTSCTRPETLKQKLHALSDLYRENSPPSLVKAPTEKSSSTARNPPPLSKHNSTDSGKVSLAKEKITSSPVLPEKPRHLRVVPGSRGSVVTVNATERRGSTDKTSSERGSLTSLCSVDSSCGALLSAAPVTNNGIVLASRDEDTSATAEAAAAKVSKVSRMRQMYECGSASGGQPTTTTHAAVFEMNPELQQPVKRMARKSDAPGGVAAPVRPRSGVNFS